MPALSPGYRALILLAELVKQVDAATSGNFMLRGMLNSSPEAKRALNEARQILLDAKKELES